MTKTRNIQIRLREDVPHERDILEYLDKYGTRSGLPKQWLIAGYENSVNGNTGSTKTESKCEPEKKPHAMSSFVAKG
ncbi:hypothetical protein TUM4438_10260 [Shewanella sairae]|uniref:Uncharacterized protein n=1 Tax=Shewanella sairae TaxID=190310 RepID=A0ABQ4P5M3_9GAMM|nr:hypothetical protein [Shewanella sairae]MCL1130460.1 hypothetical protein [Shewanella sairae]GIU42818.1 hypothetical protein TUM4438_10260 [Shewanella sairae]